MKRITLRVTRHEDGETVVVGGWESNYLDLMDVEEVEALYERAQQEWYPDGHEWREVTLLVNELDLLRAFSVPAAIGKVVE